MVPGPRNLNFVLGISWNRGPLTYLRVPLSQIPSSVTYWSSLETPRERKTDTWKGRYIAIFTRACVCNIFLASNLKYVLQVLHCSRTNIQKIHRIFATYIWRSYWEPMKRDKLFFFPIEYGGLRLCHCRQLASRFFCFRNAKHDFFFSHALIASRWKFKLPSRFNWQNIRAEAP